MTGSLGNIAEAILNEVKSEKLTKLASLHIVNEDAARPVVKGEIGHALLKLAGAIRASKTQVTEDDLEAFIREVH